VVRADLALETESAQLLPRGGFTAGSAFEFQTSPNGTEYAVPMVEPVAFTAIHPRDGGSTNGFGDTEKTFAYRFCDETALIPALAVGGEVKLPTASNTQIGSGQFDLRLMLITRKRIADVGLNFDVGYAFTGSPSDASARNPLDLALSVEWFVTPAYGSRRGGEPGRLLDQQQLQRSVGWVNSSVTI